MIITARRQALEALEYALPFDGANGEIRGAITDLRTAIEAAKMQEPFGYFRAEPCGWTDCAETDEGSKPLYEHPPAAQRQPLTDEQIIDCWEKSTGKKLPSTGPSIRQLIAHTRGIEAAHGIREKNT